jgi:hypothetical protein
MNHLSRAWQSMTSAERIVAMSLVAGGVCSIAHSAIWAAAACYMSYQKAQVKLAEAQNPVTDLLDAEQLSQMGLMPE